MNLAETTAVLGLSERDAAKARKSGSVSVVVLAVGQRGLLGSPRGVEVGRPVLARADRGDAAGAVADLQRAGRYHGAREVTGAVVQDWLVEDVPLRVFWPLSGRSPQPQPAEVAALHPALARVYKVGFEFGRSGPVLRAFDASGEDLGDARWGDYTAVLGGSAPFWPATLRIAELMLRWAAGRSSGARPDDPRS